VNGGGGTGHQVQPANGGGGTVHRVVPVPQHSAPPPKSEQKSGERPGEERPR
jgi:hypothetical protein